MENHPFRHPFRLALVLGGARAGKSRYAEQLITARPGPWVYAATAQTLDEEMKVRVQEHVRRRGGGWQTVEEPLELAGVITRAGRMGKPVLADCLTLWLSNLMHAGRSPEAETGRLLAALAEAAGPVVMVSNEVGLGIVPDNALARAFRDAQGRLNQSVAASADHVVFMAAGLPLRLK